MAGYRTVCVRVSTDVSVLTGENQACEIGEELLSKVPVVFGQARSGWHNPNWPAARCQRVLSAPFPRRGTASSAPPALALPHSSLGLQMRPGCPNGLGRC